MKKNVLKPFLLICLVLTITATVFATVRGRAPQPVINGVVDITSGETQHFLFRQEMIMELVRNQILSMWNFQNYILRNKRSRYIKINPE